MWKDNNLVLEKVIDDETRISDLRGGSAVPCAVVLRLRRRERGGCSLTNADRHPVCHSDADGCSNANPDADPDADPDAKPNADPDANPHADSCRH